MVNKKRPTLVRLHLSGELVSELHREMKKHGREFYLSTTLEEFIKRIVRHWLITQRAEETRQRIISTRDEELNSLKVWEDEQLADLMRRCIEESRDDE